MNEEDEREKERENLFSRTGVTTVKPALCREKRAILLEMNSSQRIHDAEEAKETTPLIPHDPGKSFLLLSLLRKSSKKKIVRHLHIEHAHFWLTSPMSRLKRNEKKRTKKRGKGMDGQRKEGRCVGREKVIYLQGEWRRPMWRRWPKRRWSKLSMKLSRKKSKYFFFGWGFSSSWLRRPATPGGVTANLSANSFPRVDWPVGAFVTDTHTHTHTRALTTPTSNRRKTQKKIIATIEEEKKWYHTQPNFILFSFFFFLSRITWR